MLDEKAERRLKKYTKEVHQLRRTHTDQPDAVTFRYVKTAVSDKQVHFTFSRVIEK